MKTTNKKQQSNLLITLLVATAFLLFGCDSPKGNPNQGPDPSIPPVEDTMEIVSEEASRVEDTDTLMTCEDVNRVEETPCADTLLKKNKDLTFTVKGVSFTMKPVEGGTFWMGGQDEDPDGANYSRGYVVLPGWDVVHRVVVSSFYIGETEVTQALWKAVMGKTVRQQRDETDASYYLRGEGKNYPMYYVPQREEIQFHPPEHRHKLP